MTPPLEDLRSAVAAIPPPGPALARYVEKVRRCAYAVTDADVEELRADGISEDEIFEQTVAVAVEEGLRRLEAGLEALP
jgi:hypothetical protein